MVSTTRAKLVKIGHKAERGNPDNGWCAYPQCDRKLEVMGPSGGYPRHMRGGGGKLRTPEVAAVELDARSRRTDQAIVTEAIVELREAVKTLKTRTHNQAIELGTLKNQLKLVQEQVKLLQKSSKPDQINTKRIKDGGEHAKTQRRRAKQPQLALITTTYER